MQSADEEWDDEEAEMEHLLEMNPEFKSEKD